MLLLTSVYEPFGLVLPEAMSCGLPVVSFDCPFGPSDIITDGEDGFLIANRSVSDFADKVCLLIEQPDRRRAMGKAGIASAQRYHASRIMPQWQAFFHQFN
jgi:glycosyltransferase involved in cell wall biosynthesis